MPAPVEEPAAPAEAAPVPKRGKTAATPVAAEKAVEWTPPPLELELALVLEDDERWDGGDM